MSVKNSVVVDTNVILRWLLDDNPLLSPRARQFWRTVMAGEQIAFVSESVLSECVFALQHHFKVDRSTIRSRLIELIGIKGVEVASAGELHDALLVYEKTPGLSFIDALVLCHAKHRGEPLLSYDAALSRAYKRSIAP